MAASRSKPRLADDDRRTFARLADVLVPGTSEMPSASAIGIAEALVDRVLAARPSVVNDLLVLLRAVEGDPETTVRRLREDAPDRFELLASIVVAAYVLDEDVKARIGYPGQQGWTYTYEEQSGWLAEGLLDPVIERGEAGR